MYGNKKGFQIDISGLNKNYGSRKVFNNLNITIEGGSFVAIAGRSGSGKSTLLRMISGLDSFDSGSLKVEGTEVSGVDKNIRVLFQEANLQFNTVSIIALYCGKQDSPSPYT